jgi:hypothetical protein
LENFFIWRSLQDQTFHVQYINVQDTAPIQILGTKDKGLTMKPNQEGMECWVDAAHASEWNNKTASSDPSTARSRMGYIITYAGCPMIGHQRCKLR